MDTNHTLTLTWTTPQGTRTETFEFPYRPSEEELGAKLAVFFSADHFQFDEALRHIHDCILVTTDPPSGELRPNRKSHK